MTPLESQILPYKNQYGSDMIDRFIDYWDETVFAGKNKGKAKWQLEKTWEISRRLRQWQRNNAKWDYEKSQRNALKQVEERPTHREPVTERIDGEFQSTASLFSKYKI